MKYYNHIFARFHFHNGDCVLGTSPAEEKKEREEKKMTLFRKLSFRPTVDELKARKVFSLMGSSFFFPGD